MVKIMALNPEQQAEVNRLVNERIDEFKAQQEKRNAALKALRSGGKILNGMEEQLFSPALLYILHFNCSKAFIYKINVVRMLLYPYDKRLNI